MLLGRDYRCTLETFLWFPLGVNHLSPPLNKILCAEVPPSFRETKNIALVIKPPRTHNIYEAVFNQFGYSFGIGVAVHNFASFPIGEREVVLIPAVILKSNFDIRPDGIMLQLLPSL